MLAGKQLLIFNKRGSKLASSICAPNATCTESTLHEPYSSVGIQGRYRMNDSQILYATQRACSHLQSQYCAIFMNCAVIGLVMISAAVIQQSS